MNNRTSPAAFDVLLINMPFSLLHPSIGLSLLKAGLQQHNVSVKVLYYGLSFAKLIGVPLYTQIADAYPATPDQLGEWLCSGALFPEADTTEGYLSNVLLGQHPAHRSKNPAAPKEIPAAFVQQVLHARDLIEPFIDACLDEILQHQPRIIGFTSTFQQHQASLALAQRIKRRDPAIPIIFGGANCEGVMGIETLRQFPWVDAVVSGEGDIVFPEIVQRLLAGQPIDDIQGVYTQQNVAMFHQQTEPPNAASVWKMDSLPVPDYRDFFEQKAALGLEFTVSLPFESSRGCWYGAKQHCTFCGLNDLTLGFRSKSSDRALDELITLATTHPGCLIATVDNIMDMNYFKTFVQELASQQLDVNIFYEVKANLRKDQLRLLKAARITSIQPGIESLSTAVLKIMRKGVKALHNIQLLKWCKEYEIHPTWNFLWGFPGEPAEAYQDMTALVPLLTHLTPPASLTQIRLDRFSPNFDRPDEFGLTNIHPYPSYTYLYPDLADASIRNLAYYFTYDYVAAPDAEAAVHLLAEHVSMWRACHRQSELYLVRNGVQSAIWDFRPIAATLLTILEGLEQELYLACDVIQSIDQLTTRARTLQPDISQEVVSMVLQDLIDHGLMLHDGKSYLSLAMWLDPGTPQAANLEALYAVLHAAGKVPPCHAISMSVVRHEGGLS